MGGVEVLGLWTERSRVWAPAKYVLDGEVDLNSGRKTRSQSRGGPPVTPKAAMKKAGTMQATAKEGKEFLNRGKGKKGKSSTETEAKKVEAQE
ncbi:hypothetical protein ElyMa_002851800 [Elysia marginata]|uniref:Uncharacterized protein n=1 Tax=Elysia marginata TaxID=1093978 RepID=A0AAV4HYL0_9GAST|nr:hypothetical protein ElyMa_002851800 [Elysia marginata]